MMYERQSPLANPNSIDTYLNDFRTWLIDAGFVRNQNNHTEEWLGKVYIDKLNLTLGEIRPTEHTVSIILPPGFPYQAPKVYCRDDVPLSPSWHLSPGQCLCLWQEPKGWDPLTTAHNLIGRIRDWFNYYHSGDWPKDSIVPDLHLYLDNEGIVIIGDSWDLPKGVQNGEFVFWRNSKYSLVIPSIAVPRKPSDDEVKPEPEKRLSDHLFLDKENLHYYFGFWFRLHKPFIPPRNLAELYKLIDTELGWGEGECLNLFSHRLGKDSNVQGFCVALGYPDYKRAERWLFLWIQKPKGHKLRFSIRANLSETEIKSFRTAPARKIDILRRVTHVSMGLEGKKVAVFGVGALGGSVAVLLGKSGLGEINLVDGDYLLPTNVIRHVAGLGSIGLPKTLCVERIIQSHNPDCIINKYDETWDVGKIVSICEGNDLVIDTTANVPFSLYLNQICVLKNQPILFSSAFRRAFIGRLIIRRARPDYDDPCLFCYLYNRNQWGEKNFPRIPEDPSSSFVEDGCGSTTEEADAIHIELIASLTATIAIQFLKGRLDDNNLFIQVNEALNGVKGVLAIPGIHRYKNHHLINCSLCKAQK